MGTWNVQPEPRKRLLALVNRRRAGGPEWAFALPDYEPAGWHSVPGNTTTAFGLPRGKQPEGWMLLSVPRDGEVQFEFRQLK